MLTISFPIVNCKHLAELSYYNHNVYQIESSIDCTKYTMFILEECDDDNLMEYTLAKDKDFNDIVFKWDSYWNDRIQFDKYL